MAKCEQVNSKDPENTNRWRVQIILDWLHVGMYEKLLRGLRKLCSAFPVDDTWLDAASQLIWKLSLFWDVWVPQSSALSWWFVIGQWQSRMSVFPTTELRVKVLTRESETTLLFAAANIVKHITDSLLPLSTFHNKSPRCIHCITAYRWEENSVRTFHWQAAYNRFANVSYLDKSLCILYIENCINIIDFFSQTHVVSPTNLLSWHLWISQTLSAEGEYNIENSKKVWKHHR